MKSFNIRLETVHFPHLICSFCLMKTLCTFLPCKTVFFLFHSSVFESCVLCSNPRKQNIHHLPRRGCKDVYELYQKLVTSVHLLTLFMFDRNSIFLSKFLQSCVIPLFHDWNEIFFMVKLLKINIQHCRFCHFHCAIWLLINNFACSTHFQPTQFHLHLHERLNTTE